MGKIIKSTTKLGHVIGVKNNKLLCEELDSDYNFMFEGGKRKVFSCDPDKARQIGYMDLNMLTAKRMEVSGILTNCQAI